MSSDKTQNFTTFIELYMGDKQEYNSNMGIKVNMSYSAFLNEGLHSLFMPLESALGKFGNFIQKDIRGGDTDIIKWDSQSIINGAPIIGFMAVATTTIYTAAVLFVLLNVISTIEKHAFYEIQFRRRLMEFMKIIQSSARAYSEVTYLSLCMKMHHSDDFKSIHNTEYIQILEECCHFLFKFMPKDKINEILNELAKNSILRPIEEYKKKNTSIEKKELTDYKIIEKENCNNTEIGNEGKYFCHPFHKVISKVSLTRNSKAKQKWANFFDSLYRLYLIHTIDNSHQTNISTTNEYMLFKKEILQEAITEINLDEYISYNSSSKTYELVSSLATDESVKEFKLFFESERRVTYITKICLHRFLKNKSCKFDVKIEIEQIIDHFNEKFDSTTFIQSCSDVLTKFQTSFWETNYSFNEADINLYAKSTFVESILETIKIEGKNIKDVFSHANANTKIAITAVAHAAIQKYIKTHQINPIDFLSKKYIDLSKYNFETNINLLKRDLYSNQENMGKLTMQMVRLSNTATLFYHNFQIKMNKYTLQKINNINSLLSTADKDKKEGMQEQLSENYYDIQNMLENFKSKNDESSRNTNKSLLKGNGDLEKLFNVTSELLEQQIRQIFELGTQYMFEYDRTFFHKVNRFTDRNLYDMGTYLFGTEGNVKFNGQTDIEKLPKLLDNYGKKTHFTNFEVNEYALISMYEIFKNYKVNEGIAHNDISNDYKNHVESQFLLFKQLFVNVIAIEKQINSIKSLIASNEKNDKIKQEILIKSLTDDDFKLIFDKVNKFKDILTNEITYETEYKDECTKQITELNKIWELLVPDSQKSILQIIPYDHNGSEHQFENATFLLKDFEKPIAVIDNKIDETLKKNKSIISEYTALLNSIKRLPNKLVDGGGEPEYYYIPVQEMKDYLKNSENGREMNLKGKKKLINEFLTKIQEESADLPLETNETIPNKNPELLTKFFTSLFENNFMITKSTNIDETTTKQKTNKILGIHNLFILLFRYSDLQKKITFPQNKNQAFHLKNTLLILSEFKQYWSYENSKIYLDKFKSFNTYKIQEAKKLNEYNEDNPMRYYEGTQIVRLLNEPKDFEQFKNMSNKLYNIERAITAKFLIDMLLYSKKNPNQTGGGYTRQHLKNSPLKKIDELQKQKYMRFRQYTWRKLRKSIYSIKQIDDMMIDIITHHNEKKEEIKNVDKKNLLLIQVIQYFMNSFSVSNFKENPNYANMALQSNSYDNIKETLNNIYNQSDYELRNIHFWFIKLGENFVKQVSVKGETDDQIIDCVFKNSIKGNVDTITKKDLARQEMTNSKTEMEKLVKKCVQLFSKPMNEKITSAEAIDNLNITNDHLNKAISYTEHMERLFVIFLNHMLAELPTLKKNTQTLNAIQTFTEKIKVSTVTLNQNESSKYILKKFDEYAVVPVSTSAFFAAKSIALLLVLLGGSFTLIASDLGYKNIAKLVGNEYIGDLNSSNINKGGENKHRNTHKSLPLAQKKRKTRNVNNRMSKSKSQKTGKIIRYTTSKKKNIQIK